MSNAEQSGETPMDYAEAARFLKMVESTLREKTNAGLVPHARVGRKVLFLRSVLTEWLVDDSLASLRAKPTKTDTAVRRHRKQRAY